MDKIDKLTKDALLKLATGYDYEEKEIIASKDGKPQKVKITKKFVPPDLKAIEKVRSLNNSGKW